MIVVLFIVMMILYIPMPVGTLFPNSLDWIGDWLFIYVVLAPKILWFFAIYAGGVFWYYKRWYLFWFNIVGLVCFYAPLMKYILS